MNWPIFFDRFGLEIFLYITLEALYELFLHKDRKKLFLGNIDGNPGLDSL